MDLNLERYQGIDQFARNFNIGARRFGVAGGVIVHQNERGG